MATSYSSQDMNNSKLFSDEAANIYERAIGTLLKKNMLLYFSFADYEEVGRQRNRQSSSKQSETYRRRSFIFVFFFCHLDRAV